MPRQILSDQLGIFDAEMKARLDELSSEEQQQFLEGAVFALDAVTRYAHPGLLHPFEIAYFIASAKSHTYSETYRRDLDPDSRMKALIESDGEGVYASFDYAAQFHELLGLELDADDRLRLEKVATMYAIEQLNEPEG